MLPIFSWNCISVGAVLKKTLWGAFLLAVFFNETNKNGDCCRVKGRRIEREFALGSSVWVMDRNNMDWFKNHLITSCTCCVKFYHKSGNEEPFALCFRGSLSSIL